MSSIVRPPGIDSGFAGLGVLMFPRNMIQSSVFNQAGACLMESEGNAAVAALAAQVGHPAEIQRSGIFARFSPRRDFLHKFRIQVWAQVDFLKHRGHDYEPVAERQVEEKGEPRVGAVLILYGASDGDMMVSLPPVIGQTDGEPLYTLGDEEESAVVASADYLPDFIAPGISLLDKEIRGKTESEFGPWGKFQVLFPIAPQRQPHRSRLPYLTCCLRCPESRTPALNITVAASRAYLMASVPGVPHRHNRSVFVIMLIYFINVGIYSYSILNMTDDIV